MHAPLRPVQELGSFDLVVAADVIFSAEPPAALKSKATEQLELIRVERRKQHKVEFNQAVALLKKRELEPAEELLRGILADGPDEKMRRSVDKQLGIIERAKPMRALIIDDADADAGEATADDAESGKKKKKDKKRKAR